MGFHLNAPIIVNVTRPDGHVDSSLDQGDSVVYKVTILHLSDGTTDAQGDFTASYQLDGIQGTYTVTATDGTSTAMTTFTDGPKIGSVTVSIQSPIPVMAGNATTYTVTINRGTGGGSSGSIDAVLTSTALPLDAVASFSSNPVVFGPSDDSKTSILTITTSTSTPGGNTSFTVRASTNVNTTDYATGTGTLVVQAYNHPPALSSIGNQEVDEGSLLSVTATATDLDLPPQTLMFSLANGASGAIPAGAGITPGGDFTWTPSEDQGPGIYTFDVVVSDGMATDAEAISVTVDEVNQAPMLASIGDKTVDQGSLLSFTATASDDDLPENSLTFSLDAGAPTGANINTGGEFTWTPAVGQIGEHTITLRVTDDGSPILSDQEEITVTVTPQPNDPPVADAGGPYSGAVNSPISMSGSGSTDSDGTITGYRWDWTNDGTYDTSWTSSSSTSHTYASAGSFTVTLQVRDDDNVTDTDTATVTVTPQPNDPPVADAGGPYSGAVNSPISMSGSGSTDSDGTITGYRWDWTNDGTYDTSWTSSSSTSHTYASAGSFTVTLQVRDDDNVTDTDTATVTVTPQPNDPPVADAGGPYSGAVNSPISMSGSGSTDSDGSITNYSWSFGDGNTEVGATPTHTYTNDGLFSVTLTVTDDDGTIASDTTTVNVSVQDTPHLIADAGGPYSGYVDTPLHVDASDSMISNGTITGYRWDWTNDGTFDTNWSSSPLASHTYTDSGTFTVHLEVRDNTNAADDDTASVAITDQGYANTGDDTTTPPEANAGGPYYTIIEIDILFDGSESYDPDGIILSYNWSFGDGNTSTLPMPTHSYTKEGNYTVLLTVTDDQDATDVDMTFALVGKKLNRIPGIPTIDGPNNAGINTTCTYTLSASDMDGDMVRYIITWGDGTHDSESPLLNTTEAFTISHTWSSGGIYPITAYTLDEHNATSPLHTTKVFVNAHACGDLGYLIDKNGDGIYDVFYRKTTEKETPTEKNNDQYHIDINSDGQWDYTYDGSTNEITGYRKGAAGNTGRFSIMETPWMLIILVGVIGVLCIAALAAMTQRHAAPTPKLFYIRERNNDLSDSDVSYEYENTTESGTALKRNEQDFIEEIRRHIEQGK